MKPPDKNDLGPIKAMAWVTDEEFGHDHWRAAEFSCGRGWKYALIHLFESEHARDEHYRLTVDGDAKERMVGSK